MLVYLEDDDKDVDDSVFEITTMWRKRTWFEFIEQLVTYLFNCFRTEKQQQESIGGAKGKFQEMINRPKDKIQPQR